MEEETNCPETPQVWRTRTGKDIPVDQLSDNHLQSIITMLEKKWQMAKEQKVQVWSHMTQDAIQEELDKSFTDRLNTALWLSVMNTEKGCRVGRIRRELRQGSLTNPYACTSSEEGK